MIELDADPPGPVAVAVYFVVLAGVVEAEPVGPNVSDIPLILTDVASVVVQLRVTLSPTVIVVAELEKTMVGGLGLTVTVTESDADPPLPFAVAVYLAVLAGVAETEPVGANVPEILLISTDVAL